MTHENQLTDEQIEHGLRLAACAMKEDSVLLAAGAAMAPADDTTERLAEQCELAKLGTEVIHSVMSDAAEKYSVGEWRGMDAATHLSHAEDHAKLCLSDENGYSEAVEHAEHLLVRAVMSVSVLRAKRKAAEFSEASIRG